MCGYGCNNYGTASRCFNPGFCQYPGYPCGGVWPSPLWGYNSYFYFGGRRCCRKKRCCC